MSNKIMVTGGAGFIGSHLISRLLDEGYEVHNFDILPLSKALRLEKIKSHRNFYYTEGDLRDKSKIIDWYQKDASQLFHLASVVGVQNYINDPLALIDIVVGGTRNLLELAAINQTRVLFTSTSEVYGKNPNTPWAESFDRVLGPTSVDRWSYSSSKAVCEHMLFALGRSSNLEFTIVRFFNVYGPGQAPIFVVSKSIYNAMNKKPPLIYDSGKQTRCFTYVGDAIEGVFRASRSRNTLSEVINIGSNVETKMSDLVKNIIDLSGNNLEPETFYTKERYGKSYEDIPRRIPQVEKAKELLNWEAKTDINKGIIFCMDWAKENPWWLR
ncbi:NAD-dependent epimerase/dehydratase family protein [Prochlorococcus sp. MIT 1223]|uniref:NAD-dependent epimerase/dehydratase family protein n=1 Tax=Prochlorococcus sp. MIT 1223 TaxID=3096217 RepID=UPI002A752B82|nr:GDP-mannose 4,6-dehydratase [Prochlorococcus sp. MIT 1223]